LNLGKFSGDRKTGRPEDLRNLEAYLKRSREEE
jgi:hypothetical protein